MAEQDFLCFEFNFYVVFAVVFVTFVTGGYCTAHFLIKAEGSFVLWVAAEIEIFDSVLTAEGTDKAKSGFSDSLPAEIFEEIEGLDIKRIFLLENEIAGFFVVFGDEKDEIFIGIYPGKIPGIVGGEIEIINKVVRIDIAIGGCPDFLAEFGKKVGFLRFCGDESGAHGFSPFKRFLLRRRSSAICAEVPKESFGTKELSSSS